MTIVGNLSRDNAQKLSSFMSIEPQIRLWDILQTKFKAKALQEKVYIEYDKVKADTGTDVICVLNLIQINLHMKK